VCKLPSEFCEYGPCFDRCKIWIARNCPELYPSLQEELEQLALQPEEEFKEPVPTPGKRKDKVAKQSGNSLITISKFTRSGNKVVTEVVGLHLFDIPLKEAAKIFGKKFACGSSEVKKEGD
jgi:density-regulated protein DRP1